MRKLTILVIFALAFTVSFVPQENTQASPAPQSSAYDLVAAVNSLRATNGLPAYTVNSILMQVAQAHADYMAANGTVTHYGPGGSRPVQRALDAGYPVGGDLSAGGFYSENIIGGRITAADAVEAWQGDAPHLNTMLSANLQEVGAGVTKVGDFFYFVLDASVQSNAPVNYTPGTSGATPGTPDASQYMVPVVTTTPDEEGKVYHEVQTGQALWSIAIAYGVKIDDIRRWNNLPVDADIYPGEKLLVRQDPTATPTVVTATLVPSITPLATSTHRTATEPATGTSTATAAPTFSTPSSPTTGIAVGIVLIAILIAGLFTWVSARKPA